MNLDQLMTDTFAAHEDLAPDSDAVLSVVQERINRRRSATRPLAVAASVAVVAGAAGLAVALTAGQTPARDGHGSAIPTRAAQLTKAAAPPPASIAALTMPYDLGWLPDGTVHYLARRINVGAVSESSPPAFDGEYLMSVDRSAGTIDIDVQQMPGGLEEVMFKSGPGEATTINGQPAVQSSNSAGPGGYEVYFQDSDGGLMYVNAAAPAGGSIPADQLIAIGRHVAEQVQFPGTTQVEPTFGVGYVPAGMSVRAFDVEDGSAIMADGSQPPWTSYELGTAASQQSDVAVGQGEVPSGSGWSPGRPVQGHTTRHTDDGGYVTLEVQGAVGGDSVSISSNHVSLDEMYRIADGLVLPD